MEKLKICPFCKQAAIDAIKRCGSIYSYDVNNGLILAMNAIAKLPSENPEPHYCRECKWSECHINVDKYGESETSWYCRNWYGGTDEEGYCHEWERR